MNCKTDGCQIHSHVMATLDELKEGQKKMEDITRELKESTIRLEEVQSFVIQRHEEYKDHCKEVMGRLEKRDEKQDKAIALNTKILWGAGGVVTFLTFLVPTIIAYFKI